MNPRKEEGRPRRSVWGPWLLVAGLVTAAVLYLRCGDGLGFGRGDGEGDGKSQVVPRPAGEATGVLGGTATRCQLRLDAAGLHLDGGAGTTAIDDAVRACKEAGGADLVATGDAVFGELERVREALDRAGVSVFVRDPAAGTQAPAPR